MNDDRAFERAARDWLDSGSDRTPTPVIDAVILAIRTTPQERDLRTPWRTPRMSNLTRLAAAIAVIAVVGLAGLTFIGRGGAGETPTTPPSAVPSTSAPSTAARPTATPEATVDVTAWTAVTSARFGLSYKVPTGWNYEAAAEPWIWQPHDPRAEQLDTTIGPNREGFSVASQAVPESMSTATWLENYSWTDSHGGTPAGCFPTDIYGYTTITVDGQTGYLHGRKAHCNFTAVLVLTGGRAYELTAMPNVDVIAEKVFDPALFEAWISTIRFDPASADDTPVASP